MEGLNGEQKAALDLARKKDSRKTSDKLQHEQYKKLLGTKIVPKSFDKFQEPKYNNSEKWKELKSLYRGVNSGTIIQNADKRFVKIVRSSSLEYKPNGITQVITRNGGITRNYYGDDAKQFKQISNNGHNHKKEEAIGVHGEHAHDYKYDDSGKLIRGEGRELTEQERKENKDIL